MKTPKFDSPQTKFWQTEGINHFRWFGNPELFEGEDTVKLVIDVIGSGTVRDVGCGYGRLSKFFNVEDYHGYDICEAAIKKAQRLFPPYKFEHWNFTTLAPAKNTIFLNGPHCVCNREIEDLVSLLCADTKVLVFAELMDSTFKPVLGEELFYREVTTYDEMMIKHGFVRTRTEVTTHASWQRPYTIARWEHNEI